MEDAFAEPSDGYRGKVNLIYIDPPFDSGADYVRRVQLRGLTGAAKLECEGSAEPAVFIPRGAGRPARRLS